jgi:hypothetical protein
MNFDLSTFICGGYFLAKRIDRPDAMTDLMPESVLTLSSCFTDIAPDMWAAQGYAYADEERAAEASKFGIPSNAVPTLVTSFTQAIEPHYLHNAFPTLSVAQEFYRHCSDRGPIALLGIGLESSLIQSFQAQLPDDPNRGYCLIERIESHVPLEAGGQVLGYEPLGFAATTFHSWLCHNAPAEVHKQFGIRPNKLGFIDSFDDAIRVTRNLKATGAETAIWEPWLVVQYGTGEKLN